MPIYPPLETTSITPQLDTQVAIRLDTHVTSESGRSFTWEYAGYLHPTLGNQMLKIRGRLVGTSFLLDKDFAVADPLEDETIDFIVWDMQRQLERADYFASIGAMNPIAEIEQEDVEE